MYASTSVIRKFLATAGIVTAALAASTSIAGAHDGYRHGCGYGYGHAHVHGVVVAPPVVFARPVVVRPVFYAPYAPAYVVHRAPCVTPYPVVVAPPLPYAPVVYDPVRVHVGGFIGVSGPHVSIGIGF